MVGQICFFFFLVSGMRIKKGSLWRVERSEWLIFFHRYRSYFHTLSSHLLSWKFTESFLGAASFPPSSCSHLVALFPFFLHPIFFDTPLASLCFNLSTLLIKPPLTSPPIPRDLPPKCFSFSFLCRFSQAMILPFGDSGRYLGERGLGAGRKGGGGKLGIYYQVRQIQIYKFNFITYI